MEEQEQKIKKIKQVHGNMLMVGIKLDLTVVTVMNGNVSKTKEDFYPNTDYPVSIVLKKGSSRYPYSASVNGNVVSFEDPGTLPVGVYEVEVLCRNAQAQPCRYMARSVIEIVDATIEAGIGDGVEFDSESYLLEGGVFLEARGTGIANITVGESQESGGYNVVTASNGQEGVATYEKSPDLFALALVDASMGVGMNGIEMCAEIRKVNPSIPLILMSAYRAKEMSSKMSAAGISGFLAKPFRGNDVVDLVAKYLKTADSPAVKGGDVGPVV